MINFAPFASRQTLIAGWLKLRWTAFAVSNFATRFLFLFATASMAAAITTGGSTAVHAGVPLEAIEQMAGVPTLAPVLRKITPAVVSIAVTGHALPEAGLSVKTHARSKRSPGAWQATVQHEFSSAGSGVVFDAPQGLIITNNHVIMNADQITVFIGPGRGNPGLGFAIPIALASSVAEQILEYGEIRRGQLGITYDDPASDSHPGKKPSLRQSGAVIVSVDNGSSAERAGLKPGDVVIGLGAAPLRDAADLSNQLALLRVGDTAELKVARDGMSMTVRAITELQQHARSK